MKKKIAELFWDDIWNIKKKVNHKFGITYLNASSVKIYILKKKIKTYLLKEN